MRSKFKKHSNLYLSPYTTCYGRKVQSNEEFYQISQALICQTRKAADYIKRSVDQEQEKDQKGWAAMRAGATSTKTETDHKGNQIYVAVKWDGVKDYVMLAGTMYKAEQNPDFRVELWNAKNRQLHEKTFHAHWSVNGLDRLGLIQEVVSDHIREPTASIIPTIYVVSDSMLKGLNYNIATMEGISWPGGKICNIKQIALNTLHSSLQIMFLCVGTNDVFLRDNSNRMEKKVASDMVEESGYRRSKNKVGSAYKEMVFNIMAAATTDFQLVAIRPFPRPGASTQGVKELFHLGKDIAAIKKKLPAQQAARFYVLDLWTTYEEEADKFSNDGIHLSPAAKLAVKNEVEMAANYLLKPSQTPKPSFLI